MKNTNNSMVMEGAKKSVSIESPKHFKLIDGTFSHEDAREVLLSLIQYKIQFHDIKILSNEERFGETDLNSIKRVKELRETRDDIQAFMEALENSGKKFVIRSMIDIELI